MKRPTSKTEYLPIWHVLLIMLFGWMLMAPARALDIDVTYGTMDPEVRVAFAAAAQYWESQLIDDVRVEINFEFVALAGQPGRAPPSGIATPTQIGIGYDALLVSSTPQNLLAALQADAKTADDMQAIANLQTGYALDVLRSDMAGCPIIDAQFNEGAGPYNDRLDNGGSNNLVVVINTANAKALGLTSDINGVPVSSFASDGLVELNSADVNGWDFDRSDGITPGTLDFVGIAIHEIGHILGFGSGVQEVAAHIGFSAPVPSCPGMPGMVQDALDNEPWIRPLDLFRFSQDSLAVGPGVMDLSVRFEGDPAYFSIDGGATNHGYFARGSVEAIGGDSAGHWHDNNINLVPVTLGIMDPGEPPGTLHQVSELDLMALDVIGWDVGLGTPDVSAPGFEVEILPLPVVTSGAIAYGINNSEIVVGSYKLGDRWVGFRMALAQPDDMRTFEYGPDHASTRLTDINDNELLSYGEHIATVSYSEGIGEETSYGTQVMCFGSTPLNTGCGTYGFNLNSSEPLTAQGNNDAGTLVGSYYDNGQLRGYMNRRWASAHISIDFPGATLTSANSISNDEVVGGSYYNGSRWQPFLYDGTTYTHVAIPGATTGGTISGFNAHGDMIASVTSDPGRLRYSGRFFDGSAWQTLHIVGSRSTQIWGMNDARQIVGAYTDFAGVTRPFVARPLVINTSTGLNVSVAPLAGSGVSVTFAEVTAAGNTSLDIHHDSNRPTGHVACQPHRNLTLTTSAEVTGQVEMCVATNFFDCETEPKLFRRSGAGWVDVTSMHAAGVLCGTTSELGEFSVFAEPAPPPEPEPEPEPEPDPSWQEVQADAIRVEPGRFTPTRVEAHIFNVSSRPMTNPLRAVLLVSIPNLKAPDGWTVDGEPFYHYDGGQLRPGEDWRLRLDLQRRTRDRRWMDNLPPVDEWLRVEEWRR